MGAEINLIKKILNNIFETQGTCLSNECRNIDWDKLLLISLEQQIFPIIFSYVRHYVPSAYKLIYAMSSINHKRAVDKAIEQSAELQGKFFAMSKRFAFIKGFIFSQYVYNDVYMRQFADIDILVHGRDLIDICHAMESLGYEDDLISKQKNARMHISDFAKNSHYLSEHEKKFISLDKKTVDIKKTFAECNVFEIYEFISGKTTIDVHNCSFSTLNVHDTFIVLLENTYTNFFSHYGIENDFTLRDLLDFYVFS